MTGPDDVGTDGEPSWVGALDPVANLRALGEIQQRGLQAAGDLVDRVVKAVDGGDVAPSDPGATSTTPELDRVFDLWADLFRRSVQAMVQPFARGPAPSFTTDEAAISVDGGAAPGATIRLTAGERSTTDELFLHNPTVRDVDGLHVHCGGLWAHDGTELAGGVTFDPETVDVLHARSSRGITVSISSNGTAPSPGTYRGIVLVTGLPDAWLPVEVVVEA
jgi:hypothetical protein